MKYSKKEKLLGMLVGCAYGDAMGMPSEMMTRDILNKTFPDGIHDFLSSSKNDFFQRHFQAGEVTDDTVNTLLVCDAIIENGKFDTLSYLKKLQTWVDENPEKNQSQIGPSTAKALALLKQGKDYHLSGLYGTTNGSAMKVSPLGIIGDYQNLNALVDNVSALCLPTHNTNIAITGASIICALASFALRNEYDEEKLWTIASDVYVIGMQKGTQLPSPSLKKRLELIKEDLHQLTEEEMLNKLETVYGAGFETIETIPAVLAVITLSKGNPIKAAELCANLSGDSDTIGAISTAICGAFNPIFDKQRIRKLEVINHINFNQYVDHLLPLLI